MHLDEICRVDWADVNERTRLLLIPGGKDPRNKFGNDRRIPLLGPSGYDGWSILAEQELHLSSANGRIFPYNSRSVGTAFRRGCRALGTEDQHFHDLRHEGTSRDLFDYIEFIYSPQRKHVRNGMLSPVAFEQQLRLKLQGV